MFGIHDFVLFLSAAVLLNITPGPDTFYIIGRTVAQGRGSGIVSVLGISTGSLVHTLLAAFGLSAILATSAEAFMVVKLIGACYLIYLGVRMLLTRPSRSDGPLTFATTGPWVIYRQAVLTNVLNPKVALFFLAFLPQFINSESPSKFAAFLVLGFCFIVSGTLWCLCLVWFSSWLTSRLQTNGRFSDFMNRALGGLLIALGIRLATTSR